MNSKLSSLDSVVSRLAVVTGGTRGIGGAIAHRLLADGYQCIFTGTSEVRPSYASSGGEYVPLDLRRRDQVERFAAQILECRPDVLINNVGLNVKGATETFADDEYDTLLDVNLRAPFALIRAALPAMKDRGWGRIVNITSLWSVSGNRLDAAYCASKFGLDGLTASLAAEVASSGVLANCVAPGFVLTEAAQEAYSPQDLKSIGAQIPVGRLGKPEEIASLVSWLVSEQNTYLTGQNILIDGGLTRTAKP
jgi:NAD(P)-dependent dehydrogenase (short-subunit alcohol dehydrogenase family)